LTLSLTPGPSKPNDVKSFIKPYIDQINLLSHNGMVVKKKGETVYQSRVYLNGVDCDLVKLAELTKTHYAAELGCNFCDVCGVHAESNSNGMYFLEKRQLKTKDDMIHGNEANGTTAISPLFTRLPTFTAVDFFLYNELHGIARDVSILYLYMLSPQKNQSYIVDPSNYSF
ncbi:uncharacterized protein B0P05DRAFT_456396, partial [Gilbertella persicaria]|uniref:uncharacterized protein n=1 Tax=Gilbertella persicaria TaxID=101096 RepID=UPI00221FC202